MRHSLCGDEQGVRNKVTDMMGSSGLVVGESMVCMLNLMVVEKSK
jgi:uncharacterized oligopeptide transporter (OPT) family protein